MSIAGNSQKPAPELKILNIRLSLAVTTGDIIQIGQSKWKSGQNAAVGVFQFMCVQYCPPGDWTSGSTKTGSPRQ